MDKIKFTHPIRSEVADIVEICIDIYRYSESMERSLSVRKLFAIKRDQKSIGIDDEIIYRDTYGDLASTRFHGGISEDKELTVLMDDTFRVTEVEEQLFTDTGVNESVIIIHMDVFTRGQLRLLPKLKHVTPVKVEVTEKQYMCPLCSTVVKEKDMQVCCSNPKCGAFFNWNEPGEDAILTENEIKRYWL